MAFHDKLKKNSRLGKVTRSIILKSTVFLFVENIVHGIFTLHRENWRFLFTDERSLTLSKHTSHFQILTAGCHIGFVMFIILVFDTVWYVSPV